MPGKPHLAWLVGCYIYIPPLCPNILRNGFIEPKTNIYWKDKVIHILNPIYSTKNHIYNCKFYIYKYQIKESLYILPKGVFMKQVNLYRHKNRMFNTTSIHIFKSNIQVPVCVYIYTLPLYRMCSWSQPHTTTIGEMIKLCFLHIYHIYYTGIKIQYILVFSEKYP